MTNTPQDEANRRGARKSTEPKAAVKYNVVTHGLLATDLRLLRMTMLRR